MKLYLLVCLLVSLVSLSLGGSNGLDLSNDQCNAMAQSDWNCLRQNHNFTIIEGVRGGYGVTANIGQCVQQAWKAQFQYVDLYVWMCPNCRGNNPPSNYIDQMMSKVNATGSTIGMIWLDIEACDNDPSCWTTPQGNLDYINQMVKAAQATGHKVGIYSTPWEWQTLGLTGLGVTSFAHLPLWYANPNGAQTFSDFVPFGGWTKPSIKQYAWNGNDCGFKGYDADWYP